MRQSISICCDDESSVGGVLLLVAPQALLSFLFLSAAQVPLTSSSHMFRTAFGAARGKAGRRRSHQAGDLACCLPHRPFLPCKWQHHRYLETT